MEEQRLLEIDDPADDSNAQPRRLKVFLTRLRYYLPVVGWLPEYKLADIGLII